MADVVIVDIEGGEPQAQAHTPGDVAHSSSPALVTVSTFIPTIEPVQELDTTGWDVGSQHDSVDSDGSGGNLGIGDLDQSIFDNRWKARMDELNQLGTSELYHSVSLTGFLPDSWPDNAERIDESIGQIPLKGMRRKTLQATGQDSVTRTNRDAEEKLFWAGKVVEPLTGTNAPLIETANSSTRPNDIFEIAVGAARGSTMKTYLQALAPYRNYLMMLTGSDWTDDVVHVVGFLRAAASKPCGPTYPKRFVQALRWFMRESPGAGLPAGPSQALLGRVGVAKQSRKAKRMKYLIVYIYTQP
jgi:hypothetical protein